MDVLADKVQMRSLPSQMAAMYVLHALASGVAEQVRLQYGEKMELRDVISDSKSIAGRVAGTRKSSSGTVGYKDPPLQMVADQHSRRKMERAGVRTVRNATEKSNRLILCAGLRRQN